MCARALARRGRAYVCCRIKFEEKWCKRCSCGLAGTCVCSCDSCHQVQGHLHVVLTGSRNMGVQGIVCDAAVCCCSIDALTLGVRR